MNQDILIPTSFEPLIGPDRRLFQAMQLDNHFVMETALHGWGYRHTKDALYDLLAEQFQDEQITVGGYPLEPYTDAMGLYVDAIAGTMERIAPHLYGLDERPGLDIEYIELRGYEFNLENPFFVVRLHYAH